MHTDWRSLTADELRARIAAGNYPPIAGADEGGGDDPKEQEKEKEGEPSGGSGGEGRQQHTVPLSELQKERRQRRELEERLSTLEREREAARQKDLSESERLKEQVANLTRENEQLKTAQQTRDRADLVRSASKDFTDPDEVVALLRGRGELEEIESESDAQRAVKALGERSPHLLRQKDAPDTSRLDRVLKDGLPNSERNGKSDNGRTLSRAELEALSTQEMADLIEKEPEVYNRSVAALSG